MQDLIPDSIYFFEQAPNYFVLINHGNQILKEDGSFKMIEYDGYLDRSRLAGINFCRRISLLKKSFFRIFRRSLLIIIKRTKYLIS